jgi:hypothetical protein
MYPAICTFEELFVEDVAWLWAECSVSWNSVEAQPIFVTSSYVAVAND